VILYESKINERTKTGLSLQGFIRVQECAKNGDSSAGDPRRFRIAGVYKMAHREGRFSFEGVFVSQV